jgi:hypothetical protein
MGELMRQISMIYTTSLTTICAIYLGIEYLLQNCPKLNTLKLLHSNNLDSQLIEYFAKYKNFTILQMNNSSNISTQTLIRLIDISDNNLKTIYFDNNNGYKKVNIEAVQNAMTLYNSKGVELILTSEM